MTFTKTIASSAIALLFSATAFGADPAIVTVKVVGNTGEVSESGSIFVIQNPDGSLSGITVACTGTFKLRTLSVSKNGNPPFYAKQKMASSDKCERVYLKLNSSTLEAPSAMTLDIVTNQILSIE